MTLQRRQFLHLAAGAAALPAISRVAVAQTYPTRPVRVISTVAPGGIDDLAVRLIDQSLSERFGQPFVIDNQPIAIAMQTIASALPDGHTLFFVTAANILRAIRDRKLNFDFSRDVTPVAGTSRNPFVMAINPSVPANTVTEFIAYANSNPGKLKMASIGNGSLLHLAGELFNMMTAVKTAHVPYDRLAPMESAVLNGEAQFMFDVLPPSIPYIKAGTLRALAVTSATRSALLPNVPPASDFVPGYEFIGFQGICAPKNTPPEIIDRLSKEINAVIAAPKLTEQLGEFGSTVFSASSAEYGKIIASESDKWTKVMRAANIKAE